jgi:hypothetical protein
LPRKGSILPGLEQAFIALQFLQRSGNGSLAYLKVFAPHLRQRCARQTCASHRFCYRGVMLADVDVIARFSTGGTEGALNINFLATHIGRYEFVSKWQLVHAIGG